MKHLNYVFVILLCFLIQDAYSQGQWTFYNNSYFKGYHKKYDSGETKVSHEWTWNSWKTDCCIAFYYYTRHGKIGKKTLCGDVRDFRAELKKWDGLKYGYRSGWTNIQRIEKYCDENYASNKEGTYSGNTNTNQYNGKYNNRNGYARNNRNSHNKYNGNNNHKVNNDYNSKKDYSKYNWYKHYGRGYVIFTSDYHYEGQYKARASGSHDSRSLRVSPRSVLVTKSGRYLIVEYKDHRNRRQSFKLKEDVPDLNKYMLSNLKLGDKYKGEPYKAITKFTIMRY